MTRALSVAALLAFAGSVSAQDLLFVSDFTDGSADEVNLLNVGNGTVDNLITFSPGGQDTQRYGGLSLGLNGFNGEFYIHNSPTPAQDPTVAEVFRIDGLLSGAPTVSSFISNDNSVQNVTGMAVDPFTNQLLISNNPPSTPSLPNSEGLLGYDLSNTANNSLLLPQDSSSPRPRFEAFGGGLVAGQNQGEFFFGTVNGGAEFDPNLNPGDTRQASTIGRIQFNDAGDPTNNSSELIFDGSPSFTGLTETLSLIRGIDVLPNGNLVFAEVRSNSIWELALDSNGDFAGLTRLLDLTGTPADEFPQRVIYNQFTGGLNFSVRDRSTGLDSIFASDIDGSNPVELISGVRAGSLIAIPAPGSLALLGLGGLAAARRRR
ncbi:MAG: PEP-CTERM sorting domain-containing protein [Planctomycetota bacterium]